MSNYNAFVAKNKAFIEKKYEEQVLTAEPFAGEAPLAVRQAGPLVSSEIDPQLAALAEAIRIRVRIMQGSQSSARGNQVMRVTKGEFRGFRVNALEKLEKGVAVYSEVTLTTPKKGVIKTVNRVLVQLDKADLSSVLSEVQAAGLEFSQLTAPAGENVFRAQLHPGRPWGKPVANELMIAGKSVGAITLEMPVALIKNKLAASANVLKRKVLVNDVYYDVFKVTDQSGAPMFYVYEKEGRVWGISVVSGAFRTERGIGIGSSLDQMRISYPEIKLAYSIKMTPFVKVEGVDGIFIVQSDASKSVISIVIGESPEFE